jgi:hypothetical protein
VVGKVRSSSPLRRSRRAPTPKSGPVNLLPIEEWAKTVKPFNSEKAFQSSVLRTAQLLGYTCFFTYRSKHSPHGEPDLRLFRGNRFILVELKTDVGELTVHQRIVGDLLRRCAAVEYYVWRYEDWQSGEIERILTHDPAPPPGLPFAVAALLRKSKAVIRLLVAIAAQGLSEAKITALADSIDPPAPPVSAHALATRRRGTRKAGTTSSG